jgi:hypothetical protein
MTDDDQDFFSAFSAANAELPQEPFTQDVLRRVRRRIWMRRAVLGSACVIGALSALGPLVELTVQSEIGVRTLMVQWRDASWYSQYGLTMVFLSIGVGWPMLARWLAR